MEAQRFSGLQINTPEFFNDPEFMEWLNGDSAKFTWHPAGEGVAGDYSDVVVGVDPSLNGEGTDSDMPEHIWNQIVEACRQNFQPKRGVPHILVWLTNLQ